MNIAINVVRISIDICEIISTIERLHFFVNSCLLLPTGTDWWFALSHAFRQTLSTKEVILGVLSASTTVFGLSMGDDLDIIGVGGLDAAAVRASCFRSYRFAFYGTRFLPMSFAFLKNVLISAKVNVAIIYGFITLCVHFNTSFLLALIALEELLALENSFFALGVGVHAAAHRLPVRPQASSGREGALLSLLKALLKSGAA